MTTLFKEILVRVIFLALLGSFLGLSLTLSAAETAPLTDNYDGLRATGVFVVGLLAISGLRRWQLLSTRVAWVAMALLLCCLTPLILSGFWPNGQFGISDWDYYFSYHTALFRTIVDYHTFPQWNPYICGGTSGIGDPEFPLFTPTFLLELIFGVPKGLRFAAWFATATGVVGMLALGRRLKLSLLAATTAALIFSFSSVNLLEIVEGHPNIFSAMWVPWIFWAWLTAYNKNSEPAEPPRRTRSVLSGWSVLCGIFLALTFFQGGIYMLMYVGIALLFLTLVLPNHKQAVLTTVLAGGWALGFSAIKLIPVFLWLTQFQDKAYASSTYLLPWLHQIVLGRYLHTIVEIVPDQGGGWHEYGAFIGATASALILMSLLFITKSKPMKVLVGAAAAALIIASSGPLLKPFFDQAGWLPRSNISRFMLFVILPGALLAGMVQDRLTFRSKTLTYHLAALLIVSLVALELLTLAAPLSHQAFPLEPITIVAAPAPPITYTNDEHRIRYHGIDYTRAYAGAAAGYGTMAYCTVLGPSPAVLVVEDESYTGYVTVENGNGSATVTTWTPNEIQVTTSLPESTIIILNSNFAPGWYVNGQPAIDSNNRLAAVAPAGTTKLVFSYHARGFKVGILISLLTTLAAVTVLLWARRRHYKVS